MREFLAIACKQNKTRAREEVRGGGRLHILKVARPMAATTCTGWLQPQQPQQPQQPHLHRTPAARLVSAGEARSTENQHAHVTQLRPTALTPLPLVVEGARLY